MRVEKGFDFCIECRKETAYILKEEISTRIVKEKEYKYPTIVAYCMECGEEMSIPGLIDYDIAAFDEYYRMVEDIISIKEIQKLMELYKLGKSTLSLVLGFGEVTVTRYLEGQMPSKKYSDIMREALSSPEYMEKLLKENADKIGRTAYNKSMNAIVDLKKLFHVSDKMLMTIAYVFNEIQEITPLALQKILYFIQGIYMAQYDKPLFIEDCEAWAHGPVYKDVYQIFKQFKYNPIEDNRFSLFYLRNKELDTEEKRVISMVCNSFGMYSGKIMEKVTHNEIPWNEARGNVAILEPSNAIISKETMSKYYKDIWKTYDINSIEELNQYIKDKAVI